MRFISGHNDLDFHTVVGAVHRDPDSWKDWLCIKIETLPGTRKTPLAQNISIKKILEIYLEGKQGTAFFTSTSEIVIFCKDVSEALLETMGRQTIDLIKSETSCAAIFRIYELREDTDVFLKTFAKNENLSIDDRPQAQNSEAPQKSDNLSRLTSKKVLLVEDDPVTRWMVKMAIGDTCRLTVASNAGKALDTYIHTRPDMVLLDINLPDSTGHEVINRIIQSDPAAHIIMFSSQDSFENMVSTIGLGAKGFISKPFNKQRLIECVENGPGGR